jgi:hypothetical protein
MTTKADFNAEHWDRIVEGPAIAGLMVVAAQRGGTFRESLEMAKTYRDAREEHGDSDLLGEIVTSTPSVEGQRFESAEQLRQEGAARLREAVELLEAKATPEDVDGYKRFALSVAERAAAATKSGGVLGIGGERVSEAESLALDEIASTLGVERS